MHGQHREDTKQKRHMWSEPSRIPSTEADPARLKSFCKGGRKIAVGATALFQAGDALPFIGIIRKVNAEKDGNLKLYVNWLYRPGDIELAKGASLEAAPNEIFYSFHKDEISAASLLHPCKVAFLPKGVELPSTVSHFVCRRVYDTSNKCLYWLTDQDYTDEHQGEVNRLLNKTKHEMQAGAHSERPSQRALSELTSPKRETVNVALSSQGKSKKRERTDQPLDSSKREKHTKVEEFELKRESTMKFEDFAAIAEKEGGLTSISCVDQFVQVMAEDRNDALKKLSDVVSRRTLLAGIIAATEREDCLAQFVRLGSLPMLDGWLQEAHKGKPGEVEKGLDELLLILLRALERLPVDLEALRTCNVGKSVNNLKNHKNSDVQKKARKLVDTWKKRVNAEMNSIDEAKSGLNSGTTWPSRPSVVDPLTSKGCYAGGPKSSASAHLGTNGTGPSGETTSVSGYKDLPETAPLKDNYGKAYASGASEGVPTVKEEKSCSSSQSQNNSQSWCSGSTKGAGSWKEEGKAHSVVSVGNKNIGTALRSHTKSHPAAMSSGFQKEAIGKHKTTGIEKSTSGAIPDRKAGEVVRGENHSSQRLIVRLPNPGRSPAHSTSGGCFAEGGASNNRGSSPSMVDKHDSLNGSSRVPDIHSPDTSGDTKCGNSAAKFGAGSKEEINRSSIATGDDVDFKGSDVKQKPKSLLISKSSPAAHMDTVKKGSNSSVMTTTPGSSNMNLVGSPFDTAEGGMDLLASVAASEGTEDEKCSNKSTCGGVLPFTTEGNKDSAIHGRVLNGPDFNNKGKDDGEKQRQDGGGVCELEQADVCVRESDAAEKSTKLLEDVKEVPSTSTFEKGQQGPAPTMGDTQMVNMDTALEIEVKTLSPSTAQATVVSKVEESTCRLSPDVSNPESSTDAGQVNMTCGLDNVVSSREGSEDGSKALSNPSTPTKAPLTSAMADDLVPGFYEEDALEIARQVAMEVEQEVQRYGQSETQEASSLSPAKRVSSSGKGVDELLKSKQTMDADTAGMSTEDVYGEKPVTDATLADAKVIEGKRETITDGGEVLSESFSSLKEDAKKLKAVLEPAENSNTGAKEVHKAEDCSVAGAMEKAEASVPDKEASLPKDNKDAAERPVFDLNKGFLTDEGPHDRATHATVSGLNSTTLGADRTFGFSAQVSSLAAPIAVVSAMKGPFNPPSNTPRPKGELGWKGSAATSAFRPAEPRRAAEALQPSLDATLTSATMATHDQNGKQARFLDIDLNVADERMIEDSSMALTHETDFVSNGPAASRPELDLNRVDESDESAALPESNGRSSLTAARPMLDFDLNDGLGSEEPGVDEVSSRDNNLESSGVPAFAEARPTPEFVNVVPWFTSTSSVPAAMVIPAFSGTRPDLPYPILAPQGAKSIITTNHNFSQFGGNSYRPGAPMASASVPYSATMPAGFSHAGFPFGAGFPFTSSSYTLSSASNAALTNSLPFPAASPSQLVSASAVVSSYRRPYLGSYMGEASGVDGSISWAKSGLDLNAGPEVVADSEAKDEGYGLRPTGGPGQLSYQQVGALGGPLKRKEPEGGFDPFRSNFKQMTWRGL